ATIAAATTTDLRVGTAGVLIAYNDPIRVAEQARVLQTFFPGRLRVGLASAQFAEGPVEARLRGERPLLSADGMRQCTEDFVKVLLDGEYGGQKIGPRVDGVPEIWLCGTSRRSARLAGELGLGFAYHHYLSRSSAREAGPEDFEVLDVYKDAFRARP